MAMQQQLPTQPTPATTSTAPVTSDGTTVAQQGDAEERISQTALAIGNLPDRVKNALILKRQQNIVAAQIAGTNWGKGLDLATRRAISDWAHKAGIDPALELDVLGGSFYKNAKYYLRRQAELFADGILEYSYADHVEENDELTAMAKRQDENGAWAKAELDRRARERMFFNIPI